MLLSFPMSEKPSWTNLGLVLRRTALEAFLDFNFHFQAPHFTMSKTSWHLCRSARRNVNGCSSVEWIKKNLYELVPARHSWSDLELARNGARISLFRLATVPILGRLWCSEADTTRKFGYHTLWQLVQLWIALVAFVWITNPAKSCNFHRPAIVFVHTLFDN